MPKRTTAALIPPAPTAPGPRPTPAASPAPALVAEATPPPSVERMLEDALRRLVMASPTDIVGSPGLTNAMLTEYVAARAKAQELLDIVAFGR